MYRNAFAYRKPVARKPAQQYPIALAWAAVAAADRVNEGQYVNDNTYFKPEEVRRDTNKSLAYKFIESPDTLTDSDREMGEILSQHFSGLLFKSLTGPITNGFVANVANIVAMENVGRYEVACMAPLVRTYRGDIERENKNARMQALGAESEFVGGDGSRHVLNVRILETFYSQKYESLIVTAISGKNIVKFFTSKAVELFAKDSEITVKGSVKRTSINDRTGAKETWLTRVKVV